MEAFPLHINLAQLIRQLTIIRFREVMMARSAVFHSSVGKRDTLVSSEPRQNCAIRLFTTRTWTADAIGKCYSVHPQCYSVHPFGHVMHYSVHPGPKQHSAMLRVNAVMAVDDVDVAKVRVSTRLDKEKRVEHPIHTSKISQ